MVVIYPVFVPRIALILYGVVSIVTYWSSLSGTSYKKNICMAQHIIAW